MALRRPILSTVGDPDAPAWGDLMEAAHPRPGHPARSLAELLLRSRHREALVLRGSVTLGEWYRDLVFALVLRRRRHPPRTVMTDATWEPRSRSLTARMPWLEPVVPVVARVLIRALDGPHLRFAVLSEGERATFSEQWGIPQERVVFTPFPMTLYDDHDRPTTSGDYVFAGGNSLRDYDLLAQAVRGTGIRVRVATTWQPEVPCPELEVGPTTHEEFVDLLAGCRAMVLPLQTSVRSAGQQTYLNAMVLGKPVVVTEGLGVTDYITPGVTGVVVPSDVDSLRAALRHVMDPVNASEYAEMGARARADVKARFMPEHYVESILSVLGYRP
ncbi:glycosyltransferase family 4 protein [Arsenicicoccus dermatophilus]|uniref:glycosyltransferase family 4 protein n=1 Tax=Arsenicicoccus dermatophilus TaxID=1076331 RepID=UPI0039175A04